MSVNALFLSIKSWHSLPSGARLYTGDIMTGLMTAGGGLGLLVSLFIGSGQRAPSEPHVARRAPNRENQLTP